MLILEFLEVSWIREHAWVWAGEACVWEWDPVLGPTAVRLLSRSHQAELPFFCVLACSLGAKWYFSCQCWKLHFSNCWYSSTFCYLFLWSIFSFYELPSCTFSPFFHYCAFLSY